MVNRSSLANLPLPRWGVFQLLRKLSGKDIMVEEATPSLQAQQQPHSLSRESPKVPEEDHFEIHSPGAGQTALVCQMLYFSSGRSQLQLAA